MQGYTTGAMPRLLLTAAGLAIALLTAGGPASCGLVSRPLEPAAAAYYNFMSGAVRGPKYSSFLNPAYRKALSKDQLGKIDGFMEGSGKKNEHARLLKKSDVRAASLGSFGVSAPANPVTAMASGGTKWVKDGGRWFLYLGNEAEVKKYGPFPVQLQLPPPQKDDPNDPDRPQ
jgi:hypothetical protein